MTDQMTENFNQDAAVALNDVQDLLGDVQDPDKDLPPPEYDLRISPDRVTVLLDCPDPLASLEILVNRILADFTRLEIPVYPDAEQLTSMLRNVARPGRHLRETPLIMGEKVVPSQDGKLAWAREYFSEGWAVDEKSGAIDFWEKLEHRSVTEGEMMVKLLHPVEGEPGLNVFGMEIPVTKPTKVKLRCGKGVRTEEVEDGIEHYATVNGRVRYTDGTVSVDDVYIVKGNVSLATGNIRHTGAVQIQGDVEAGATIDADGDVMIKGMVDPCDIRCGGTLTVVGGMVGDQEHSIEVGGDFNARYVNEYNITVGGDVTVSNEISHSKITAQGRVKVVRGRIAGGCIKAYKGITVAEAGASGSSDTTLMAGIDSLLPGRLDPHKEKIKKLEEAQEKIQNALKGLRAKDTRRDPDEEKLFAGLSNKLRQLGQAMADEFATVKRLTHESKMQGVLEVAILQEIWSGTRIHLGEYHTVVRASIQKPRIAQLRQTRVRILPLGDGNMPDE